MFTNPQRLDVFSSDALLNMFYGCKFPRILECIDKEPGFKYVIYFIG